MYGGSFVGMTQWRTAAQHPPHLAGIAPYVPIYPGWDVPNTNGIAQAWTNVVLGYVAGRSLNTGFIANQNYWSGKMLEEYASYRPFSELDEAIGIAPDDWWMLDQQEKKKSMFKVWLDHVGDEGFNLAAEPKAADYAGMTFPVLTATGFFDDDQPGALRYYRGHMGHAPTQAANNHYLVIGPWITLERRSQPKKLKGYRYLTPPCLTWGNCTPTGTTGCSDADRAPPFRQQGRVFHARSRRVALRENSGDGVFR